MTVSENWASAALLVRKILHAQKPEYEEEEGLSPWHLLGALWHSGTELLCNMSTAAHRCQSCALLGQSYRTVLEPQRHTELWQSVPAAHSFISQKGLGRPFKPNEKGTEQVFHRMQRGCRRFIECEHFRGTERTVAMKMVSHSCFSGAKSTDVSSSTNKVVSQSPGSEGQNTSHSRDTCCYPALHCTMCSKGQHGPQAELMQNLKAPNTLPCTCACSSWDAFSTGLLWQRKLLSSVPTSLPVCPSVCPGDTQALSWARTSVSG